MNVHFFIIKQYYFKWLNKNCEHVYLIKSIKYPTFFYSFTHVVKGCGFLADVVQSYKRPCGNEKSVNNSNKKKKNLYPNS